MLCLWYLMGHSDCLLAASTGATAAESSKSTAASKRWDCSWEQHLLIICAVQRRLCTCCCAAGPLNTVPDAQDFFLGFVG